MLVFSVAISPVSQLISHSFTMLPGEQESMCRGKGGVTKSRSAYSNRDLAYLKHSLPCEMRRSVANCAAPHSYHRQGQTVLLECLALCWWRPRCVSDAWLFLLQTQLSCDWSVLPRSKH